MRRIFWKWAVTVFLCAFPLTALGSAWQAVELPSRPINIAENNGVLWVCGADELIASSTDGGNAWTVPHIAKGGAVLLDIGFANSEVGYAVGTGGSLLLTNDSGKTWKRIPGPDQLLYAASFSDENHGIVHASHNVYFTSDGGASWKSARIDAQAADFNYVSTVLELDPQHMIIVMSEGSGPAYHQILLVTKDGGATWKPTDVPSTGLQRLSERDGQYWFAGHEVINKDKPGGGYGVSLLMHSSDGETWTPVPRWSPKEFDSCNKQGCLYWDGAGVQFPPGNPVKYWTFPAEKVITSKWAVANGSICTVSTVLECAPFNTTETMPPYVEASAAIPPPEFPPALNAPPSKGLQCISCGWEHVIVTPDFQGPVTAEIQLDVGVNGLVEKAELIRSTKAEIGDLLATMTRSWIFVPNVVNGVVHPTRMTVRLQTMAVKSR